MTRISRSIKVQADARTLWQFLDMRKWNEISNLFSEIDTSSQNLQVGDEARITAGPGVEKVNYTATIVALEPEKRLEYMRSGGPLPGKSEWEILPNGEGIEVAYHNTFNDQLAEPVKRSMEQTMERFLGDLKLAVENGANGKNAMK